MSTRQKQRTPRAVFFAFVLIFKRTRKAGPENDLNGHFPAVAFPQKSESFRGHHD